MKTYRGFRDRDYVAHVVVTDGRHAERSLPWKLRLYNHSPTGLEWGYAGSGPAQLALALLADALGDNKRALRLHQFFKFEVIALLPRDTEWTMTDERVREVADFIEHAGAH